MSNDDKVVELLLTNLDFLPESMEGSLMVFLHDLKINPATDHSEAEVSYTFTYRHNDRHAVTLSNLTDLMEKEITNALTVVISDYKENI